jgi:RND family efflux transporter MFP subunit
VSRSILRVAVALAVASASLSACKRDEPDARTEPPLVRTALVGNAGPAERAFSGIVSARVQSDLGFRVAGKIAERLVDAGEKVRRGQPLMRIDRTDFTLATAALAGQVEAARAQAEQTAADEARYRGLVAEGAVSVSAYGQIKASSDAAAAQLKAAEARTGVARNEAEYSVLLADADGVVMETLAEPGQVVSAGQTVVRLARSGPREALINLPEGLRPALGSRARATLYSDAATAGSAQLRQLSGSADLRTRTFEARYVLEGAAADAALGATVVIHIADTGGKAPAQVPLSALYDNGKGPGVWVVAGKEPQVSWRPIRLAGLGQETATVVGGLVGDERYVTLGAHLLHEGDRVRIAGIDSGAAQ